METTRSAMTVERLEQARGLAAFHNTHNGPLLADLVAEVDRLRAVLGMVQGRLAEFGDRLA